MTGSITSESQPRTRRWLPRLIGVGLFTVFVYSGYNNWQRRSTPTPVENLTTPVERADIPLTVSASGSVEPERFVNVTPKRPGIVEAILVEEGDTVEAAQVVGIMDSSDLQGQLLQARGNLAATQANLERLLAGSRSEEVAQARARLEDTQAALRQAEDTLRRDEELLENGAISRQRVITSEAAYERALATVTQFEEALRLVEAGPRSEDIAQARAQVEAARGVLVSLEQELADTQLKAPFPGVVSRKFVQAGAFIAPSTVQIDTSPTVPRISPALVSIAGPNQVTVNVAESDVRFISEDQLASIRADAYPDLTFTGRVKHVSPQAIAQQNVISFEVKLSIEDDNEELLRPGMSVDVDFDAGLLQDVLVVPTVAIVREDTATGVYVLGEDAEPIFNPLSVGLTVGDKTVVREGLQGDEKIFLSFPEGYRRPSNTTFLNFGDNE
ncbi:MAG: efflux RND transporter periplasmic adaptor subunit [Synechococcaceae cyanobacterium SM2_3_1]|nr:efflux RND transporter periplasmic adaptor subunit [Synechococcaceae cyanobacterium SM2_3_1]